MPPELVQALARNRIADLHREASQHRLARTAPRRPGLWSAHGARVLAVRATAAGWIARTRPTAAEPACCPS